MSTLKTLRIALVLAVVATPGVTLANGLGEDRPFQFRDANERIVDLQKVQTMETKKGNGYTFNQYNTYSPVVQCQNGSAGCGTVGTGASGNSGLSIGSYVGVTNSNGTANVNATQHTSGSQLSGSGPNTVNVGAPLR